MRAIIYRYTEALHVAKGTTYLIMTYLCFVLLPLSVASATFLEERDNRFQTPEVWEASDGLEWDRTWGAGIKPGESFDAGSPLPALENLVKTRPDIVPRRAKVLIPGCGRGYAVEALSGQGRDVVGIDIAPTAVATANEYLQKQNIKGKWAVTADPFFDFSSREHHQDYFDLLYDYNFLSIIPPHWRTNWASRVSSLLTPGGVALIGLFPTDSNSTGGPPWALDVDYIGEILERNGLKRIYEKKLAADEVHKGREGRTVMAAWRRPLGLMHYQMEWYSSWQIYQKQLADDEARRGKDRNTDIAPWVKQMKDNNKEKEIKAGKNWHRGGARSLR